MAQLFANNASSTLVSGVAGADTALALPAGDGALFPSLAGADFFLLTLTQPASETSWEIVKVTARAGDALTVVRAQEGTAAAAWGAGTKAELRLTAASMSGKQDVLVSGVDIKTVNGLDLLGSGDLSISKSVDGGSPDSVYTTAQHIDGGTP